MTDTSSTTGIAVTAWARTIKGRPAIGGFAERSRRTGMADVAMFTEMTGDRNPLHYDAALAAGSPFGGLIVQGGVTSGLLNAVVAEDLPGPGTVFLGVEWRFLKAVHIGEDHRPRRGRHRSRRQADLHNGNLRSQRARRSLPFWQRRHLHSAAAGGRCRLAAAFFARRRLPEKGDFAARNRPCRRES